MIKKKFLATLFVACSILPAFAEDAPFTVKDGMFNQNDQNTLGLTMVKGAETFTVFSPTSSSTNKFCNGIVMCEFKGNLYCMWQASKKDEDASDTYVAYSRSTDGGKTWSAPTTLAATISNGYCS